MKQRQTQVDTEPLLPNLHIGACAEPHGIGGELSAPAENGKPLSRALYLYLEHRVFLSVYQGQDIFRALKRDLVLLALASVEQDEPFSSLDIKTKTLLIKRFNDIFTNNPRTVVFVTHDVDEALALADTIIVLKDKNADFILNLSQDKSTRVYGEDVEKRKIIFDYLKK